MTDVATERPVAFRPHPGPQMRFLSLRCLEVLYGGAAGGGKSSAGVVDFLRYVGKGYGPYYKGVLFRRTFPEIEKSLLPETQKFFPALGGRYKEHKKLWVFPQGERCYLGHAEHENDIKAYLGAEVQYIYFDELTTFLASQYLYALSRLRSTMGIPVRLRSGTNPGSEGHEWVFKRWAPWLDPESTIRGQSGEVLYFIRTPDGAEVSVPKGTLDFEGNPAIGRTFIGAKLSDNPSLDATYTRNLSELDPVTKAQLKDGNWLIRPGRGLYYKRVWLRIMDASPANAVRVRFWDKAATQDGGDWTVGVKMARPLAPEHRGKFFVEDVKRVRLGPGGVEQLVKDTAKEDGPEVAIRMAQDPGSAGKFELAYYVRELVGYDIRGAPETGDKVTRQNPVSAQASMLNIFLVRGKWNEAYLQVLEAFPEGDYDDDVDATAGAFRELTSIQEYVPPAARPQTSIANGFGGY